MELKKAKTFKEQVELLKCKNIIVENEISCENFLSKVNYYRFSAYYLPFKDSNGVCSPSTEFEKIKKIYEFDQKLRILILEVIEHIEISIRTQIAYYHAHKYGALGYMSPSTFGDNHDHTEFTKHIKSCIQANKKTLIVKHHIQKYDGNFPLWVIIEFFPIGMLSHFYRELCTSDQKSIANNMKMYYKNLLSWLRCITDLRNKCAHYSRLYFTSFPAIPKMPQSTEYEPTHKLFWQLFMLKNMYPNPNKWNDEFVEPLENLIKKYLQYIELSHMDFPYHWESILKN